MKPFHFTATAFQELVIWADSEDEASAFIADAVLPENWQMEGAEHNGEVSEDDAESIVRHGASVSKPS